MAQLGAAGPPPGSASMSRRRLLTIVGGGTAGALVIGGVAGTLISRKPGHPGSSQIKAVPTAGLPQFESTLAPDQAARLMDQARRCTDPLAQVTIWHSPGKPGGFISIISGAYRSPRFPLTATPSVIALPFPAPYATGQGVFTIVGEANDFIIALEPLIMNTTMSGAVPISVWWEPVGGCP
jgi:hypothetical protein